MLKKHEATKKKPKRGGSPPPKTVEKEEATSGSCRLCAKESTETLQEVEKRFLKGEEPEAIAEALELKTGRVQRHIQRCLLNKHRSRYERVASIFDDTFSAIQVAKDLYMENPTSDNAYAYSSLINTLRGALQDLNAIQSGEELAEEITDMAVNPLIRGMVDRIADETNQLQSEVAPSIGEAYAKRLVDDHLERIGGLFKNLAEECHGRMVDILTARDKNRRKATTKAKEPKRGKALLEVV